MKTWRVTLAAALLTAPFVTGSAHGAGGPSLAAVPKAKCGKGSLPESRVQGQVPSAEIQNGRAAKGYRCNTTEIGHFGTTAGFKVLRYVDKAGHVCGFYDTTRLFPTDAVNSAATGLGVYVLDMKDPAHPKLSTTLVTPAMLTPHESLLLNEKRGLLVADAGTPMTDPGVVDVYDVSQHCLQPTLKSSTPTGILGHESAFAPDGKTFYVSAGGGSTLTALDLTNPSTPYPVAMTYGTQWHGARVSADGRYLYAANMTLPGLDIFDVSSIQSRAAQPTFKLVSQLTWPSASIPQVPIPMTIRGHKYLLEIDEFAGYETDVVLKPGYHADSPVGAARIINIDDVRHPRLVSNIRLAVNNRVERGGAQKEDPGPIQGTQFGGYAGHYCSVPREVDPGIVACSFLASGERIFNVQDPAHPREVAYFNRPSSSGGQAYSQAAWDLKRHQVWYTDAASGLWVFQVSSSVWPKGL